MGEILGSGITHYPPLLFDRGTYADILRRVMASPVVSDAAKDPAAWPAPMREEHSNEATRAAEHQQRMIDAFRHVRRVIDDFAPDAIVMFGDDQYENFREDCLPPFCVLARDHIESRPFHRDVLGAPPTPNVWGEDPDTLFVHRGDKPLAIHLTNELCERGFPVAASLINSHHADEGPTALTHAFLNALLYLDWDRRGFDYPIVPVQVNAYGKQVVPNRGGIAHLDPSTKDEPFGDEPGPPAPSPAACAHLGAMTREILQEMPGRYVIMATSGWSHAFLTAKHSYLYPDVEADRRHLADLREATFGDWAKITNDEIDNAGDQEFRNWICLAGAMDGYSAEIVEYLETYIFNSNKCFAIFRPA